MTSRSSFSQDLERYIFVMKIILVRGKNDMLNLGYLFQLYLIWCFCLCNPKIVFVFYNKICISGPKRHKCLTTGETIPWLLGISYVILCNLLSACWLINTHICPFTTCSPAFYDLKACFNDNTIWLKPINLFHLVTSRTIFCAKTFWSVYSSFQAGKYF